MPKQDREAVEAAIEVENTGFGEPEENTEADEKEDSSPQEEVSDEQAEGTDNSEIEEAITDGEEPDGEEADSQELEDEEPIAKKTGVQKRIDKLTARLKELEAANENLTKQATPKETSKVYNDEQLDRAEDIAWNKIDEGDSVEGRRLLREVSKERLKNQKRDLVGLYEQEKSTAKQQQTQQQIEWTSVMERYSSDDPDMDIRNESSKLFKLSKKYFEDKELSAEYTGKGGMLRAVSDAFLALVKTKGKTKKASSEKKLERKLAKARRKTSLGSGSAEKGGKSKGPKSTGDPFKDYIAERKAFQTERGVGV